VGFSPIRKDNAPAGGALVALLGGTPSKLVATHGGHKTPDVHGPGKHIHRPGSHSPDAKAARLAALVAGGVLPANGIFTLGSGGGTSDTTSSRSLAPSLQGGARTSFGGHPIESFLPAIQGQRQDVAGGKGGSTTTIAGQRLAGSIPQAGHGGFVAGLSARRGRSAMRAEQAGRSPTGCGGASPTSGGCGGGCSGATGAGEHPCQSGGPCKCGGSCQQKSPPTAAGAFQGHSTSGFDLAQGQSTDGPEALARRLVSLTERHDTSAEANRILQPLIARLLQRRLGSQGMKGTDAQLRRDLASRATTTPGRTPPVGRIPGPPGIPGTGNLNLFGCGGCGDLLSPCFKCTHKTFWGNCCQECCTGCGGLQKGLKECQKFAPPPPTFTPPCGSIASVFCPGAECENGDATCDNDCFDGPPKNPLAQQLGICDGNLCQLSAALDAMIAQMLSPVPLTCVQNPFLPGMNEADCGVTCKPKSTGGSGGIGGSGCAGGAKKCTCLVWTPNSQGQCVPVQQGDPKSVCPGNCQGNVACNNKVSCG
jgi:hypothetical protein